MVNWLFSSISPLIVMDSWQYLLPLFFFRVQLVKMKILRSNLWNYSDWYFKIWGFYFALHITQLSFIILYYSHYTFYFVYTRPIIIGGLWSIANWMQLEPEIDRVYPWLQAHDNFLAAILMELSCCNNNNLGGLVRKPH